MLKRNGDGKVHIDRVTFFNGLIKTGGLLVSLFLLYLAVTGEIRANHDKGIVQIEQKIVTTSDVLNDKIEKETGELGEQMQAIQSKLDENIQMDNTDHSTFKTKIERNEVEIQSLRSSP